MYFGGPGGVWGGGRLCLAMRRRGRGVTCYPMSVVLDLGMAATRRAGIGISRVV